MDPTTQIVAFFILLIAFVVNALVLRRNDQAQRRIGAFDLLRRLTGESIESSRPLHLSLGGATIGDDTTMLALAGSEFMYYATRAVAVGDAAPLFTVANGAALPLAIDTLHRAYTDARRIKNYSLFSTRWYPTGQRSLAFGAALNTIQTEDQVSGNVLAGRYGLELVLILDAAYRHQRGTIAVSDRLDGQAIAYALADEALIGEEVFAAAGYLSQEPKWLRRNTVIDVGRWLLIASILALVVYNLMTGG